MAAAVNSEYSNHSSCYDFHFRNCFDNSCYGFHFRNYFDSSCYDPQAWELRQPTPNCRWWPNPQVVGCIYTQALDPHLQHGAHWCSAVPSAWKSSPKTEKRPQLDQTKTTKDWTSSLSLSLLRFQDHKKTGYGGPVFCNPLITLQNTPKIIFLGQKLMKIFKYCTISIDSAITCHKVSGFDWIPSPVLCHRSSGQVHLVDLLAVKKLDHIFAQVWGSSGRLAKATWLNFFQHHRSSAIWPYAKFHPWHHRSHPRPNQSKWYSISCK